MKFGKYLAKRQLDLPEYSNYFINYKALKKLIKSLSAPSPQQLAIAPQHAIEKSLQENKATFFFRLERELEKVNSFYLQKEAELKLRADILREKKSSAFKSGSLTSKRSVIYISLYEGFQRFRRDLDRLQQFIELNATGFSKVLKKWDKRSKSQTKELYLSRAVEVQPVFHREELAEMSDIASSSILELEAWADGDNVIFSKESPSSSPLATSGNFFSQSSSSSLDQLRATDDLYNEFIKTASSRDSSITEDVIAEWISQLQRTKDAKEQITRIFLLSISTDVSDSALAALYNSGFVDIHATDEINGQNCLHKAADAGRRMVIDLALNKSVDINRRDIYGRAPLHYVCLNDRRELIALFLESGADIDAHDKDNFSPLLISIINHHSDCVRDLIHFGAKVEVDSEKDYIPLNLACQYGEFDAVKILLDQHPNLILPDAEGLYPIHVVARAGHSALVPLLKSYDVNINEFDKLNKWTALFYAASEGHLETVKALIAAKADTNIVDEDGQTPLYYASWEGHIGSMFELSKCSDFEALDAQAESASNHLPFLPSLNNDTSVLDTLEDMDISANDLDGIPDLSLPPPILPLRRYGHNFLDKKTFLQLLFDPAKFIEFNKGETSLPVGRLTIASRNNSDIIPKSIILPISDVDRVISFQVDSIDDFAIDFEIFPTFGTRMIAKSAALPYIFSEKSHATFESGSRRVSILPLFDMRLQTIGEIAFQFQIVKPFQGAPLEITKFDTYWKSTSQIEQQQSTYRQNSLPSSLGSNASHNFSASLQSTGIIQPSVNIHGPSQALSFVTASSLSGEYARIYVCLTRDLIPVVTLNWSLNVRGEVEVPIGNLTLEKVLTIAQNNDFGGKALSIIADQLSEAKNSRNVMDILQNRIISLELFLRNLSPNINLDISIFYPTGAEISNLHLGLSSFVEINSYVDHILMVVFDHARELRSQESSNDAPFGGRPNNMRSLIFSSCHPDVCTVLNWKQPNFPVFFHMNALKLDEGNYHITSAHGFDFKEDDRRCTSLKEAATFAASNNLLGIICPSKLLSLVPRLIPSVRALGLVLVAESDSEEQMSVLGGVDGIRNSDTLIFKGTIDM